MSAVRAAVRDLAGPRAPMCVALQGQKAANERACHVPVERTPECRHTAQRRRGGRRLRGRYTPERAAARARRLRHPSARVGHARARPRFSLLTFRTLVPSIGCRLPSTVCVSNQLPECGQLSRGEDRSWVSRRAGISGQHQGCGRGERGEV